MLKRSALDESISLVFTNIANGFRLLALIETTITAGGL